MRAAVSKCAAIELELAQEDEKMSNYETTTSKIYSVPIQQRPYETPSAQNAIPIAVQPLETHKGELIHETHDGSLTGDNIVKPNFDPEKLHQAILAYRPVSSNLESLNISILFNSNKIYFLYVLFLS